MTAAFESIPVGQPFVDAHLHVSGPGGLLTVAKSGIIAVRDAGLQENAQRDIAGQKLAAGPVRVIRSGWALCKPGGYGSRIGLPIEGAENIRKQIQRLKAAGVDIIKVIVSGIVSLQHPGTVTPGGFAGEELAQIVSAASEQGLGVMAHANGEGAILACAHAGVRSVEHGFFMTRRAVDAMAERGTFWVPTAGALVLAARGRDVSQEAREFVSRLVNEHLEMIGYALSAGVPLAVGTDCVLPNAQYAEAYRSELEYFSQAGLDRERVLNIACKGGADLLGLV